MSHHIVLVDITHEHPLFRDVLDLRARVYQRPEFGCADEFDAHSTVHVALCRGAVVGSMRVTFFDRGPVCCQPFMPKDLIEAFHPILASASRFCMDPAFRGTDLALRIMRHAWSSGVRLGKFIDIIDVKAEVTRYYERLGYRTLAGPVFIHPRLGTRSRLMVCSAHPTTPGTLNDLFANIATGSPMLALRPWLEARASHAIAT